MYLFSCSPSLFFPQVDLHNKKDVYYLRYSSGSCKSHRSVPTRSTLHFCFEFVFLLCKSLGMAHFCAVLKCFNFNQDLILFEGTFWSAFHAEALFYLLLPISSFCCCFVLFVVSGPKDASKTKCASCLPLHPFVIHKHFLQ